MMFNNQFLNFGGGFAFWHHVHWVFILALLVGIILFLGWAFKSFKKEDFSKWATWLIIVGAIGMLLTSSFGGFGFGRGGSFGAGYGMMTPQMFECAQDEECHDEIEALMEKMMGFDK